MTLKRGQHRKYLPYAFTENGVAMPPTHNHDAKLLVSQFSMGVIMSSPMHFEPQLTFFQELGLVLKNFIQGQFLIALCNAIVAGLAFWIMGINHALLLGAIVGLMSFIPYLGPILGFLPAMIMAWITHHNFWYILGVMGVWALIQVLESLVFQPKILGDKLKIHPLLVILSFVAWGALLGMVGVLLAVPLTAILQIIIRRIHARVKRGRS